MVGGLQDQLNSAEGLHKFIDVLAVLPLSVAADGSIINAFLCRTDAGLRRIEERLVWEAMEKGQYREGRRRAVRGAG
jgi:hypothetical protein